MNPAGQADGQLGPEQQIRLVSAIALQGDRAAFSALFSYFAPRIKSFMLRAGMADAAAEELAQEVLLVVWRKAASFDCTKAGVSTWIFTIARNKRIDMLRRGMARPADLVMDPSDEPDGPLSGEDITLAVERDQHVRAALQDLSIEQVTILKLSYYAEKPHSEIAQELGIPLGTVKSRIRLALARLRTALDGLS